MRFWRCLIGKSNRDDELKEIKRASQAETKQLRVAITDKRRAVDAMVSMLLEDRRRDN